MCFRFHPFIIYHYAHSTVVSHDFSHSCPIFDCNRTISLKCAALLVVFIYDRIELTLLTK